MSQSGTLQSWDPKTNTGTILSKDNAQTLSVAASDVSGQSFSINTVGQEVNYEIGSKAVNVKLQASYGSPHSPLPDEATASASSVYCRPRLPYLLRVQLRKMGWHTSRRPLYWNWCRCKLPHG